MMETTPSVHARRSRIRRRAAKLGLDVGRSHTTRSSRIDIGRFSSAGTGWYVWNPERGRQPTVDQGREAYDEWCRGAYLYEALSDDEMEALLAEMEAKALTAELDRIIYEDGRP
jgi:hypothetical protein